MGDLDLLREIVKVAEKRVEVQRRICTRLDDLVAQDAVAPAAADAACLALLDAEERLLRARMDVEKAERGMGL